MCKYLFDREEKKTNPKNTSKMKNKKISESFILSPEQKKSVFRFLLFKKKNYAKKNNGDNCCFYCYCLYYY